MRDANGPIANRVRGRPIDGRTRSIEGADVKRAIVVVMSFALGSTAALADPALDALVAAYPDHLASYDAKDLIWRGVRWYVLRMASLNLRTQPKPAASATSFICKLVSSISFLAKCRRRV